MTSTLHRATIPVFIRGLTIVSDLIGKGMRHAAERNLDPSTLVEARLAPDMLNLAGQIQRASDTAKLSAARLSGVEAPSFPDNETSLEALQARCAKTIAFLRTVPAEAFDGAAERDVPMFSGERRRVFKGEEYLYAFALPNFFFHVTTAYDLLRQAGVPIGKLDYLGSFDDPV
ncbi:hypothetical protein GCM10011390_25910 [Aureimonas endophytica]|uniref:DUF1993 domain-containing protein n=1 Tax=Aureimonas endophytica TaxID=2027858 RepID=A0A916ZPI2_9HYPH|nr:DUF1993 domain-containing protein [Aureimonas endophytica]GGE05730.1 hypothetical protein GCM10011390_25910 [Aureimonas endophytica]